MKNKTMKMVVAALCLALTIVLPFITGEIPTVGKMLCPMHIPVFLCGMICGPIYGLIVGAIAPFLRFVLVGMPPLYPSAVAMCAELATYGVLSGIMAKVFPKKIGFIYLNLVISMLVGRVIWGLMRYLLASIDKSEFTFKMFIAGGFTNAIPGIILQLIIIPVIVTAVRKAFPDMVK